jgi:hypothetical protein
MTTAEVLVSEDAYISSFDTVEFIGPPPTRRRRPR